MHNGNSFRPIGGLVVFIVLFWPLCLQAQFQHRAYLGWITDHASEGRPTDPWPSIRIDDKLLTDFETNFRQLHEMGFQEVVIWGFFTSRKWPLDIQHTIDENRRKQVLTIIDMAHRNQLKVLSGVGVYSWGFDDIIRANPQLACPENTRALCLHHPESWVWQKKVLDYVLSFPIDGIGLQSADQGRCKCEESSKMGDVEYHAALNQQVIQYVRKAYPGKTIGINSWGMDISKPEDLPHLKAMTKDADYFTDVRDHRVTSVRSADFRAQMIEAVKPCLFGTIGTPNIEPPQHWQRDRWFLPTAKRAAQNLQQLYREGGRSVENYMHILANPSDEATIRLQAAIEQKPLMDWAVAYKQVLSKMFSPRSASATNDLFDLFVKAEDAYFDNVTHYNPTAHISLEPLVSDKSGEPIYISNHMTVGKRQTYLNEIESLTMKAESLRSQVGNPSLLDRVVTCLKNTKEDIVFTLKK